MLIKGFHEAPSCTLIDGSVLKELLAYDLRIFEADRRDIFNIYLYSLAWIKHLFIRLGDILWVGRLDGSQALALKIPV